MSVVIETTLGDITVDLYLDQRPVTCLNFLKLCKMKYYNFNLFHSIRSGFIAQTGDPTGEGSGGQSIWGILQGPHKRFFSGEKMPKIRHTDAGLLSMVCTDDMMVGSQFFITLAPDLNSLDGTHCVIGEVTEGHEVLTKLNEVICDESHRPYRDVRITHTVVLEDPFNDPTGLRAPSRSPSPNPERLKGGRIAPDEEIDETQGKSAEEVQEMIEEKEAKARATILEIVGDLPDAEIAPPENVLFVCKLNPVTTDEDLEIIFSRFGKIVSCEVIRDKKSGNSLQYAFIEFDNKKACEDAYFKMDNVLIDDRRIHVDFSQSVSKMRWLGKGRGVQYFNKDSNKNDEDENRQKQRDMRNRQNDKDSYSNGRKYHNSNRNDREKRHRDERDGSYKRHKERSRSRSRLDSNDTERHRRGRDKDANSKSSRHNIENQNSYSSSHKSALSPQNNKIHSDKSSRERHDRLDYKRSSDPERMDRNSTYNHITENNDSRSRHTKHKENRYRDNRDRNKDKVRYKEDIEPKTPSPIIEGEKLKDSNSGSDKKIINKKKIKRSNLKKKRKHHPSTSSSKDSSESSSSSETSSSSESDDKRKKLKRKRRKYSTSSSSSSTSSSSSSSSSSSGSSSESTSSSDNQHKKKHNNKAKRTVKKNKKKL